MKKVFEGKKKIITVPLVIIFGFALLPFTIAFLLAWFVNKKVVNKKIKYASFTTIALFTLFFGSAWVIAMTSPSNTKQQTKETQETKQVNHNSSQTTKPIESSISPSIFKAQTAPNNPKIMLAKVVTIIDGDTIDVDLGEGNIKRVRYIGIDTPEAVDPRKSVQCYGKEASAKNKELVGNGIVGLEKDASETDQYGRLLRYVYMGDLFINQVLVSEGYAHAVSYPPDIKYQDKLRQAEQQAKSANKGLWEICNTSAPIPAKKTITLNPTTIQTNTNISTGTNTNNGACKYSCMSPDRDCSDFSSQTDAQSFFNCCGFSATNDPMRLDNARGVGNGIACESL